MSKNTIGIECKSCSKQWRLEIPIKSTKFSEFACLCECGEIIVGNVNHLVQIDKSQDIKEQIKSKYLTNGGYQIISIDEKNTSNLPLLELE